MRDLERAPTSSERIAGVMASLLLFACTGFLVAGGIYLIVVERMEMNVLAAIVIGVGAIIAVWSGWKFIDFLLGESRRSGPRAQFVMGIACAVLGVVGFVLLLAFGTASNRSVLRPGLAVFLVLGGIGWARHGWRRLRYRGS